MQKFKISATDIIILLLSVLFLIGTIFWFNACGPKEDGSYMNCHWAGVMLMATAAVLATDALAHLLIPDSKVKAGLSAAMIPLSILACIIPGNLISLCMMESMRCRSIMTPAAIVFGALIAAVSAADVVFQLRRKSK